MPDLVAPHVKMRLKLARQSPPSDRGRKVRAAKSKMTANGRTLKCLLAKAGKL